MFRDDIRPRTERIVGAIGIIAVAALSIAIPLLLTLHSAA